MGLAERFKEQLQTNNIFENKSSNNREFENVSKKVNPKGEIIYSIDTDSIIDIKKYTTGVITGSTKQDVLNLVTPIENLITSTKSKISKTPCWNEYSRTSKEKMLEKYFDTKMKGQTYTNADKTGFINSIIN